MDSQRRRGPAPGETPGVDFRLRHRHQQRRPGGGRDGPLGRGAPSFGPLTAACRTWALCRGRDSEARLRHKRRRPGGRLVSGDHAFLWTAAGGMQDLNALIDPLDPLKGVTTLADARGINNLGQIVGLGIISGKSHAFLVTPVPEPETYAMMVAGLGLLGFMLRRQSSARRDLATTRSSFDLDPALQQNGQRRRVPSPRSAHAARPAPAC